ncbi:MAG: sugar ABC transporter permease [Lachnospiraceae bacterium]|nr:sugar ABC transporter permease [Lachnospiraceae bacterium]
MSKASYLAQPKTTVYRKKGYVGRRLKESWQWYVLLAPALIYIIIFAYGPMYGVLMAFQKYRASKGIWGSKWIGFENFIRFFNYPNFWKMIRNTLSITLLSLATFPCSIIFALFLNEITQIRFKKVAQMVTYIPHFLSEVVVCSLVILMLDRTSGPINNLIALLGGERQAFMGNPDAFSSIYVLSGLWQNLGWNAVLYISALASIPNEQIEAARIDGASRFQIMRHVNLPGIMPTVVITFLMQVGRIMTVGYTKILLLQNDLNLDVSSVISTYTYEIGIIGGQYSYSAAIGLFNNVINIVVLLLVNKLSKKITEVGLF